MIQSSVNSILKALIAAICAVLISCSEEVKPPNLNRPQGISIEACRSIGLDLRELTEPMIRKFIDCMDAGAGKVKEYKAFFDSLSSKEINTLLRIYNVHMVEESRFKKALELFSEMHKRGELDEIANSMAYLIETGFLQDLLPFFRNLYGVNETKSDPAVEQLNQLIVKSIDRDIFGDFLTVITKILDSGRMRMIISLLLQAPENPNYGLDSAVDEIANALYLSMESGGFQEISTLLSDPMNHRVFQHALANMEGSTAGINSYFEYLTDASESKNRLWDIIQLTRFTDRPALCFEESGHVRRVENIFDLGLAEVKARNLRSSEELASFYIEEAAFHLKNLEFQCKLPAGIPKYYTSFIDLIRKGFGPQINQMELSFDQYQRLAYLKRMIGSPQLNSISNLIQNSKQRNILAYIIDLFVKDLSEADFRVLAKVNFLLSVEDLSVAESRKWFQANTNGRLQEIAMSFFEKEQKGIIDFLFWLDEQSSVSETYSLRMSEMRQILADFEFVKAPGIQVIPVLQKTLSPRLEARKTLKQVIRSLMKSWSKSRESLSDLFASIASGFEISKDTPFQWFIRDLLSDKQFVHDVNPILLKISESKEIKGVLDLSAKLARNGEFTRLLLFFHDISRALPLESLSKQPLGKSYQRFRGDFRRYYSDYKFKPEELNANYDSCLEILQHSGNWNSNYLKNLAQCLTAGSDADLNEVIALLESIYVDGDQNVLDVLGSMLSTHFIQSPLFFQALEDLKDIHRTGTLSSLFDFLLSLSKGSSQVLGELERLAQKSCVNESELSSAEWLADLVLSPSAPKAAKAVMSLALESHPSYYADFKMQDRQIEASDLSKIQSDFESMKSEIRTELNQKIDQNYLNEKIEDYKQHNEEYLYGQGLYEFPGVSESEKVDFYSRNLIPVLRYAARGSSMYALAGAFAKLDNKNYPWKKFFDWSTGKSRIIRYWQGSNKTPFVRIVSPLEQAEILVLNSRIAVARNLPGLGVQEVGSYFQLELAKSKNQKETLKKLKSKVKLGLSYSKLMGKKEKWVHLRNIRENFSVLEELEEEGLLDFFVELYKSLYEVTPVKDRVQDRERLYSSLVHEPMSMGMLTHLSYFYQSLKYYQLEEEVLATGIHFFKNLRHLDAAMFRKLIVVLIDNESENFLLSDLLRSLSRNQSHWNEKDFLNSLSALMKLSPNPAVLFPVIRQVLSTGEHRTQWIDFLISSLSNKEGEIARMLNNIHYLDLEELQSLREFSDLLFKEHIWLESLVREIYTLWKEDPQAFEKLSSEFKNWRIDNESEIPYYLVALRDAIEKAKLGLVPVFAELIRSEGTRQSLNRGFCAMAEKQKLNSVFSLVEKFKNGDSLDRIFEMLDRHFSR